MYTLLEHLVHQLGEAATAMWAGAAIGLAFGFFAQRSRFCLRSAVIEFARGHHGGKLTVWLFAFATAVWRPRRWRWPAGSMPPRRARSPRAAACRARRWAVRCSAWA
jgi:hypothetical protein